MSDHVNTLSDFSSCEISDALIKLGIPHGGYIPDISMFSPGSPATSSQSAKICAPAYTVKMVLANDSTSPRLSVHFVDTVIPGSVIVIAAPPGIKNAVWGGLMTAGAKARGAVGVIISGRCRDLAEHRAAGFPVFARGHSTLGQGTFVRPSAINIPLVITPEGTEESSSAFPSTEVLPGDWIVADEDGVVCVPQALVNQVVELAAIGREIDAKCMKDIKAGVGIQASFLKYRGK